MAKKIIGRTDSALRIVRRALKAELAFIEKQIRWVKIDISSFEIWSKGKGTDTDDSFKELNKFKNKLRKLYASRRKVRVAMEVACAAIKGTKK